MQQNLPYGNICPILAACTQIVYATDPRPKEKSFHILQDLRLLDFLRLFLFSIKGLKLNPQRFSLLMHEIKYRQEQ